MTPKQKKVLDFIKKFFKDNGYSPSQKEVGYAIGTTQTTARLHIQQLIQRGFLKKKQGNNRSLEIL